MAVSFVYLAFVSLLKLLTRRVRGSKIRVPGVAAAGRGLWEHRRMLLSFAYLAFSAVLRLLV